MSAEVVIIAGGNGTGKSTSMRNLPPEESFLINVLGKQLPFPGWKKKWRDKVTEEEKKKGILKNMINVSNPVKAVAAMKRVHDTRPNLKYIVVDDSTYFMTGEFMRRRNEKSFEKWNDMSYEMWDLLRTPVQSFRPDVKVFYMWHTEEVETGNLLGPSIRAQCKTLGKSLTKNVGIEGIPRIVLHTHIAVEEEDPSKKYFFITQNLGNTTAKSPMKMFGKALIPNDLMLVIKRMDEYDNEGIIEEWEEETSI